MQGFVRPDMWVFPARLGRIVLWAAGAVAMIFMAKRGV